MPRYLKMATMGKDKDRPTARSPASSVAYPRQSAVSDLSATQRDAVSPEVLRPASYVDLLGRTDNVITAHDVFTPRGSLVPQDTPVVPDYASLLRDHTVVEIDSAARPAVPHPLSIVGTIACPAGPGVRQPHAVVDIDGGVVAHGATGESQSPSTPCEVSGPTFPAVAATPSQQQLLQHNVTEPAEPTAQLAPTPLTAALPASPPPSSRSSSPTASLTSCDFPSLADSTDPALATQAFSRFTSAACVDIEPALSRNSSAGSVTRGNGFSVC